MGTDEITSDQPNSYSNVKFRLKKKKIKVYHILVAFLKEKQPTIVGDIDFRCLGLSNIELLIPFLPTHCIQIVGTISVLPQLCSEP